MTRKEFLKKAGIGAAFVLTVPCLHSCGSDDDPDGPQSAGGKDFMIDLTDANVAAELGAQGYVIREMVVVTQFDDGTYGAASQVCSHTGTEEVIYDVSRDEWFCRTHGARFAASDGDPLNDVTDNPLRIYNTSLDAATQMLRVFG